MKAHTLAARAAEGNRTRAVRGLCVHVDATQSYNARDLYDSHSTAFFNHQQLDARAMYRIWLLLSTIAAGADADADAASDWATFYDRFSHTRVHTRTHTSARTHTRTRFGLDMTF